jgi:pimeloyl-ACP methyl ester carboxylesterase
MKANTAVSSPATWQSYTTGSVVARDGTTLGYRQLGRGPGLVVVHGSMSTGYYHLQLAEALADSFTVYLPDRRGFGLSGPISQDDGVQKDVEDLDALLEKTGTHNVFGVSVGAIIALKAALSLPAIHKLAIYEPPLFSDSRIPTSMSKRFDEEMAQGKTAAALTTVMKGAPLISDFFSAMPRWLIELMTKQMLSYEAKKGAGDYAPFAQLAPTLHHDGWVISEMSGQQESLITIRADILLLGGSRSTAFLKAGLDGLEKILPHVKRVELPGLDHAASWNANRGGRPESVARELRRFFV